MEQAIESNSFYKLFFDKLIGNTREGAIYNFLEYYGNTVYDLSGNDLHINIEELIKDSDVTLLPNQIGEQISKFWDVNCSNK